MSKNSVPDFLYGVSEHEVMVTRTWIIDDAVVAKKFADEVREYLDEFEPDWGNLHEDDFQDLLSRVAEEVFACDNYYIARATYQEEDISTNYSDFYFN